MPGVRGERVHESTASLAWRVGMLCCYGVLVQPYHSSCPSAVAQRMRLTLPTPGQPLQVTPASAAGCATMQSRRGTLSYASHQVL